MKFARENLTTTTVRRVANGTITIGDRDYRSAVAVTPGRVLHDWTLPELDALSVDDLRRFIDDGCDLVLIGTGSGQVFPPRELVFGLARRAVGLEVMDTAAAARTFNVLMSEDRQVGALFYL